MILASVSLLAGIGLLICSAPFWIAYIGHGLAYGAWLGMPGRENQLKEVSALGLQALRRAAVLETSGLLLTTWFMFSVRTPLRIGRRVPRLAVCVVAAFFGTLLTFAFVRGA